MPDTVGAAEPHLARIAVAGAGWWSQGYHLPQLHANGRVELAAIIEPSAAPRSTLKKDMKTPQELSEHYGVPAFNDVDEFLASDAAKRTDGLIVASSHATHAEIGLKAMAAGLRVLMEKPMTCDVKEALALERAARGKPELLMVNNSANYREQSKQVRELLQGGSVGKIRHVSAYMGAALMWLFDNAENVGWVKPSGGMLGNGFGWGQMSHVLAWIYFVTDLAPKTVYCLMGKAENTGADIFDTACIKCECGATICVQGVAAIPFESYEGTPKQIENKIFGSEGYLTYSGSDGAGNDEVSRGTGGIVLRRFDKKDQDIPGFVFEDYKQAGTGPASIETFIDDCLGEPFVNCADASIGLRAVQTIEAMYRSVASGQAVEVTSE